MMSRLAAMFAVLLTALLLQTVVFAHLSIAGWRPNIVLVTVVAFALADGPPTGMRYGFSAGLATDLLSGAGLVGLSALVYLVVGYAIGLLRPYVAGTVLTGQVAVAGVAGALAVLAHGVIALLLDVVPFTPSSVLVGAVVIGAYDALVAPFVFRPVQALSTRLPAGTATPGPLQS